MALSDSEKADVIFFLGWPGLTIVADSTHFNSVVNDRLNVTDTNAEISRIASGILIRLTKCDTQLDSAKCRLAASKVDNLTLNEEEIAKIKNERRRFVRELSDHLDIPIMKSSSNQVSIVV